MRRTPKSLACLLGFTGCLASLFLVFCNPVVSNDPRADDQAAEKQKLIALQQERRDVLREIVDEFEARHREGVISYQPVSEAIIEWLKADLELARDRGARIAVRERILQHLRKVEKAFTAEVGAGPGKNTDILGARATRLQAEVELLREQMSND